MAFAEFVIQQQRQCQTGLAVSAKLAMRDANGSNTAINASIFAKFKMCMSLRPRACLLFICKMYMLFANVLQSDVLTHFAKLKSWRATCK